MPFCPARRLHFIHVPKTAGTSLITALGIPWPEDGSLHWTARQYVEAGKIREGYASFAVARDPVDRFLSAVNFAHSEKTVWHVRGGTREHPEYRVLKEKPLAYVVDQLEQGGGVLKHQSWWPQHRWLTIDGELAVDFLLRFEHLQQDLDCLLRRLGHDPVRLPYHNRSDRVFTDLPEDLLARVKRLYRRDYELFSAPRRRS